MQGRLVVLALITALTLNFLVGNVSFATNHSGKICNETWYKSGNPHIITGDVTVDTNCTLRIESGVRVYFYLSRSLILNGTLKAIGLASDKIYFTSAKDTTGGPGGSPGDWSQLVFNNTSVNDSLIYCTIRYGGDYNSYPYYSPVVMLKGASPLFQNCTVRNNSESAFRCQARANPKIHDCQVWENGGDAYSVDLISFPDISFPDDSMSYYLSGNHGNGIAVDLGTLTENSTWRDMGPCYWLKNNLTIDEGVTLKLEPGVVVKLSPIRSIIVNGILSVKGQAASSINFTSYRDDEIRQDTDGDPSNGSPGDWSQLIFNNTSVNDSLIYCTIRYGGDYNSYPYYSPVVMLNGASPLFQNCTVRNNSESAFRCQTGSSPKIHDCQVWQNGGDAYSVDLISFPDISFPDDSMSYYLSGNHGNGIAVDGGGLSQSAIWRDMGPCYWLRSQDLTIGVGITLILEPGVVVKLSPIRSIIVNGTLRSVTKANRLITITSYRDDIRQDTDGDGNSTGSAGDWSQLIFNNTSVNDSLIYCTIRYGGDYNSYPYYSPVVMSNGASPYLRYCTFTSCSDGLIQTTSGSDLNVSYSNIVGSSTNFGVENLDHYLFIQAKNNYWGDSTGPNDPTDSISGPPDYNPGGKGCKVSDYVSYRTWLRHPYICGDANGDGLVSISDIVYLINYIFKFGPEPEVLKKGDANGDGKTSISDVVYLINYLLKGGPPPIC
jgi:hypothetical protein